MPSSRSSTCSDSERLWKETNADLGALKSIVVSHFQSPCLKQVELEPGSFARVFLYYLHSGMQIIARVVLPVRDTSKTEAEVASMDYLRACTTIPVPKVYLFCSSTQNPVGAEWILMEYMPGVMMSDCFEDLTQAKKLRTAEDLARLMHSLFEITAPCCGSLLRHHSLKQSERSPRYNPEQMKNRRDQWDTVDCETKLGKITIGPINQLTLLDYPDHVPAKVSGPVKTERKLLELFSLLGIPGTRENDILIRRPYLKVLEIYDVIRPLYGGDGQPSRSFLSEGGSELFRFSHGDLRESNILIDTSTGAISGVIDWEMSGFYPAWYSAVNYTWFNDDANRFVMWDDQDGAKGYDDETADEAQLRRHYSSQIASQSKELYRHEREGVELRSLLSNLAHRFPGNVEGWIETYEKYGWDVKSRGSFPFNVLDWIVEGLRLSGIRKREMKI